MTPVFVPGMQLSDQPQSFFSEQQLDYSVTETSHIVLGLTEAHDVQQVCDHGLTDHDPTQAGIGSNSLEHEQ
jgi:hypothetical protein